MINLLPPIEKKALLVEQKKKLIIILGSMSIVFSVCGILILLSLNFYLLGELAYEKVMLESLEKKYQTPDFIASKSLIEQYNALLLKADHFYDNTIYASDVVAFIATLQKPSALLVTNIEVEKDKERNIFKIMITGTSASREALQIFKNTIDNISRLEESPIKNVYFPSENWIKPANINFRLSFEYEPIH